MVSGMYTGFSQQRLKLRQAARALVLNDVQQPLADIEHAQKFFQIAINHRKARVPMRCDQRQMGFRNCR